MEEHSMKKSLKILSLISVFALLYGMVGFTAASAAERKYLNFYPSGQRTVEVGKQDYFQAVTSASEPPTVKSSDTAILGVELDKIIGDATLKTYQYRYRGLKAGSVTVTLTSKDGLSARETFVVKNVADTSPAFKSDTTGNVNLKQGYTYCIKITSFKVKGVIVKPVFSFSVKNVLKEVSMKQLGSSFYYKFKAVGKVGQAADIYTSASGVKKVKQCRITVVSATKPQPVIKVGKVICDTSGEFGVQQDGSYLFRLTASDGFAPIFTLGTKDIFALEFVRKSGNDFYYKITAIGKPGQAVGVYTAAPGQKPMRQCKVFIKER
jgi:hypothetical protein